MLFFDKLKKAGCAVLKEGNRPMRRLCLEGCEEAASGNIIQTIALATYE